MYRYVTKFVKNEIKACYIEIEVCSKFCCFSFIFNDKLCLNVHFPCIPHYCSKQLSLEYNYNTCMVVVQFVSAGTSVYSLS